MAKRKKKKVDEVKSKDDFYSTIENRVISAKNDCESWRQDQLKWHKLRMRIKKTKTFPFNGCANLRLPTVETKLRKLKAQLAKIIFGVRPIVQAVPTPSGNPITAQKIEKFVDYLIMDVMKYKPKGIITIDQTIERGFFLNKPYWRVDITTRIEEYSLEDLEQREVMQLYSMQTTPEMIKQALIRKFDIDMHDLVSEDNEKAIDQAIRDIQSGKDKIKIAVGDVIYNAPDVALVNPEFFYVNNDSRFSPRDLRMGTHEIYLPYDTVKRNVTLKQWSAEAVNKIDALKTKEPDNLTENEKDYREGIERINNPSQLVKIWEIYLYYDLNNDNEQEKCLFTFAPEFKVVLRKITLDNLSGNFPLIKFMNELCDDRWFHHRGLAELIEDLVKEIDTQHNQKLDSQTWRNAPIWSYRAGVVNPNLIKGGVPGLAIARHDKDDLVMMQNANLNVDYSYEKEQMILETKIEELIGQVDFSLHSMINKRQPRTLGEVNLQQQSANQVFSLDADLYIDSFGELASQVWELWCQRGDPEVEFAYFGRQGWEKIKLTKEEIQGKYPLVIRGNDQNYNPQVRQQKAQMILQDTYQALQMNLSTPIQANNARRKFYQEMDIMDYDQFIPPQPPQLPQPPPQVKMGMEDLTPKEQAQVKSKQGIQPDVQGMSIKKNEDMKQRDFENKVEILKNAPEPEKPGE